MVHLQPLRRDLLLKCALQPKVVKIFTKATFCGGSRSFKVIDVDKSKKAITSACYDMQHVCLSATVFTLHEIIVVK